MSTFISVAFRNGLILGALLTLDAALPNPARAGDTESTRARFAAIMLPPGTDPSEADRCRPVICALQRNGYRDPLRPEKGGAARIAAAERPLRSVINKALDPEYPEVEVLLYYRGPVLLFDGTLGLGASDAKFSLNALANRVAKKLLENPAREAGQPKQNAAVALLLDVDSESSLEELEEAVSSLQQQFPMNLHVVIGRRESANGSCPLGMVQELRRALTYDGSADGNGDKAITTAELGVSLAERLRGTVDVAYVAPANASAPMPIAWLGVSNLEEAIDDFSNEIVHAVRGNGAAAVVIDDFTTQGLDASSGHLGPLAPYVSHQVRLRVRRLLEEAASSVAVSADAESAEGSTAVVAGTILVDLGADPVLLELAGNAVVRQEAGPSRTVRLHGAVASLSVEEVGMSGHLNMSPRAVRSAGIDWGIDELDASPATALHPMADPNCPFRVYLESEDGVRLHHWLSDDRRHMNADVAEGDQYTIAIENRTNQDVFLRLLVDGRNTLPDRSADDEPYEPAQYVSLTRARCWFCEAKTSYRIDGFYTDVDAGDSAAAKTGRWRAFRVTDVANVSPTGDYRGQLGIVTAAFYQAVAKADSAMASQPEFATCPGSAGSGRLDTYDGDLGPGPLIGEAPINIYYGFRYDGDH